MTGDNFVAANLEKQKKLAYVARKYYMEDQKQSDIARELGVSRPLISRMLSEARELGIVEITIHEPGARTARLLERLGLAPDRATVALRGRRADRDMARTAAELCQRVRRLVVDAPSGGEELAVWLRREFGLPILPPGEEGHAALCFQEGCPRREEGALELYGPRPGLAGLTLSAPGLSVEDREDLPLLAALWEGGRLDPGAVKIT